jgi:TP901 family phage tail tape measure protein
VAEVIKTVVDVELNTGQFSSQLQALQQQINAFNLTLNKSQLTQGQGAKHFASELVNAVNRGKFFRAELISMQTSAAALDSTLSKGQASLGQFFSAAFNKRSAMAAETFALASERARTMQTQFVATGKAAKGMQEAIAIRPLSAFSSEAAISAQRMQILNSMFKQGTTQLINFGKNVQWAGRQLMVGFTVPLTIFGTVAGRVFRDLEKEVVSFKKVYGDLFTTPAELNENLEAVRELASEYTKYGIAIKDTIGLAAQAAAAGRQNAELTDAVTQATRLGTLGQMEQNQALETTIALQSAFKLSGQDLADTINFLNMVENQTVVSLQDLAAAIPRVAPVIKGLGGDVKDMSVFLAAMQEGGVSAEQGANALKSGLASLINPTKNALGVLSDFGINLQAIIDVNKGDLMATVQGFATALQTLDEFSRQQALEEVFGKFQYARLGALFENIVRDGSQASQVLDTMKYSSEELAQTADKELKTIEESFGVQLTSAIEKFKLAIAPIGELFVKMAIPIVNFVTKIANWFNSLPEGTKNLVAIATVITGVVVPAATMMFGLFMNLVGTLAKMSQGVAIFGATLVKSGPLAALKSLGQSTKYLSLAEIDAANAAKQLGSATAIANQALLQQAGASRSADAAIRSLTTSYRFLIAEQAKAAALQPEFFATGRSASGIARSRIRPPQKRNAGGEIFTLNDGNQVPGTGNTDTVPAMLTPGEFVVNKDSTARNISLLHAINDGMISGFNNGGKVPGVQYFATNNKERVVQDQPFALTSTTKKDSKFITSQSEALATKKEPTVSTYQTRNVNIDIVDSNNQKVTKLTFSTPGTARVYDNIVDLMKANGDLNKKKSLDEKLALGMLKRGKDKLRVNAGVLQDAVDTSNLNKNIYNIKGIKEAISKSDKAHIQRSLNTVLDHPLMVSGKNGTRTIPKGVPLQFLNNKVIEMGHSLNRSMAGKGVLPGDLLKELQTKKTGIFGTQNAQFEKYLNTLNLDGAGKAKLLIKYKKALQEMMSTYEKSLIGLDPKTRITDSGLVNGKKAPGVVSFEDITKNTFSTLNKDPDLKGFSNLLDMHHHARIATRPTLLKEAEKLLGSRTGLNKLTNYELLEKTLLKKHGSPLPVDIDEFLKSVSTVSPKTGKRVLGGPTFSLGDQYYSKSLKRVVDLKNNKDVTKKLYAVLFRKLLPIKMNKGGLVPKAVSEYMSTKYPQMSPAIKEIVEKYVGQTRSNYATMYTRSSEFNTTIDQIMREVNKYGEKHVVDRLGKAFNFNSGGKVPGMQYLFGGGIAQKARQMYDNLLGKLMLGRSVHGGPSGISSFHGIDKKGWHGSGTYLTQDKFTASAYAQRSLIDSGSMGTASLYSFTSKGIPNVLNLGRKISKSQKEELINIIKSSNADNAYKKVVIDAISKSKTLDEARIIARSLPMMTNNLDDLSLMSTKLRDDVSNVVGMNDPSRDLILGLQSKKTVDKKSIRTLALKLEEMSKSGKYSPSIGGVNFQDDLSQSVIKNMERFNWKETPIDFKNIPGARKGTQEMFNMFGMDPMVTGMMQASKDPRTAKLLIASIFKSSQFDARQREFLSDLVFGTRGRINLRDSDNPILQALYRKISGTKKQKPVFDLGINKGGYINSKMIKLNDGNIVPGVGNTDTVPAMLTPGEFVINKEATKQNLDLLHSINNGTLSGYNKGGKVRNGILYANDGVEVVDKRGRVSYKDPKTGRYVENPNKNKTVTSKAVAATPAPVGRGARIGGAAVGIAAGIPFMSEGAMEQFGPMGSMVASMVAWSAATSLATKGISAMSTKLKTSTTAVSAVGKTSQGLSKVMQASSKMLTKGFLMNPYTVAFAALVISTVLVKKVLDNIKNSGAKLSNAMYGSSEGLEKMSKALGKTTATQTLMQRQAERIAGREVSEETKQMSSQFMQTEEGKELIKQLEFVRKNGGDPAQALKNQLLQGLLAGVLTPEEAQQIATDIGVALKDSKISAKVVADITSIIGPDGKSLKNNKIEILSEISAPTNIDEINKQIESQFSKIKTAGLNPFAAGFDSGLLIQRIMTGFASDEMLKNQMAQRTLQENVIQNALKEREIRASITLEYEKQLITFEEMNKQMEALNKNSIGSKQILDSLNTLGGGASDISDLKYNPVTGGIGEAVAGGFFKQIGALFSTGQLISSNRADSFDELEGIRAQEAQLDRLKNQITNDLTSLGLDEKRISDLMGFFSKEFKNEADDLASVWSQLVSGELSYATAEYISSLETLIPGVTEKIKNNLGQESLFQTGGFAERIDPFSNSAKLTQYATDVAMGARTGARQGTDESDLDYLKRFGDEYLRVSQLPTGVIKSLEIDIESPIDIMEFGPKTKELTDSWNMLVGLNPRADKEAIFKIIALDGDGNIRSVEEIEADAIKVNKAFADLESGDRSRVKKGELQLVALYNGKEISDPEVQKNLNQLKKDIKGFDDFDSSTKSKLISLDAQVDAVGLEMLGLEAMLRAGEINPSDYYARIVSLRKQQGELNKEIQQTAAAARITTAGQEDDKGSKSAFQTIMDDLKAAKNYQKAVTGLVKGGVKVENIALIDQAQLLEMSVSQRKKAIEAMKEQEKIQKTLSVAMLSDQEQQIRLMQNAIKVKDNEIKGYERQIEDVERLNRVEQNRIDNLQRQNELDQRQVALRNKALDQLSKKEDEVNKVYDTRFKSLDAVSKINDRLAQQRQDRIALASALTSGDFGAAASAASTMSANFAGTQIEDARAALEEQRQATLKTLTADVNGQLLTRVEIENQIDAIEENIYQRNLLIQGIQDIIFEREQALQPIRDKVFELEGQRLQLARDLEDAEFNKWKTEQDGINAAILGWNEYWKARRGQGGSVVKSDYGKASDAKKKKTTNKMYGGVIKRMFGGGIFKGSSEAPPTLLRANSGMEVPGIGLSDKVPALLTPGEFVVRKSVAQANLPFLKSLNSDVFPSMSGLGYGSEVPVSQDNSTSTMVAPVYNNNYNINVNVAGTDSSPNEIADAVMNRIRMGQQRQIRGIRR